MTFSLNIIRLLNEKYAAYFFAQYAGGGWCKIILGETGTVKRDSAVSFANQGSRRQVALWATVAEVEDCAARAVRREKAVAVLAQSGAQRAITRTRERRLCAVRVK